MCHFFRLRLDFEILDCGTAPQNPGLGVINSTATCVLPIKVGPRLTTRQSSSSPELRFSRRIICWTFTPAIRSINAPWSLTVIVCVCSETECLSASRNRTMTGVLCWTRLLRRRFRISSSARGAIGMRTTYQTLPAFSIFRVWLCLRRHRKRTGGPGFVVELGVPCPSVMEGRGF